MSFYSTFFENITEYSDKNDAVRQTVETFLKLDKLKETLIKLKKYDQNHESNTDTNPKNDSNDIELFESLLKEDLNDMEREPKLRWTKILEYNVNEELSCTLYRRYKNGNSNLMLTRQDSVLKNIQLKTVEHFWNNQDKYGNDSSPEEISVRSV